MLITEVKYNSKCIFIKSNCHRSLKNCNYYATKTLVACLLMLERSRKAKPISDFLSVMTKALSCIYITQFTKW